MRRRTPKPKSKGRGSRTETASCAWPYLSEGHLHDPYLRKTVSISKALTQLMGCPSYVNQRRTASLGRIVTMARSTGLTSVFFAHHAAAPDPPYICYRRSASGCPTAGIKAPSRPLSFPFRGRRKGRHAYLGATSRRCFRSQFQSSGSFKAAHSTPEWSTPSKTLKRAFRFRPTSRS